MRVISLQQQFNWFLKLLKHAVSVVVKCPGGETDFFLILILLIQQFAICFSLVQVLFCFLNLYKFQRTLGNKSKAQKDTFHVLSHAGLHCLFLHTIFPFEQPNSVLHTSSLLYLKPWTLYLGRKCLGAIHMLCVTHKMLKMFLASSLP